MISLKQKSFFDKKDKGFTLAEILIIAGIVALIGSIILIFSKGAIEKAKIAKLLQFSANIHHALGAEAVGIWDFNEGTETKVIDSSGYGNDGTIYKATWTKDAPSQTGYGLSFTNDQSRVEVAFSPSLNFDDKITVSIWIKFNNSVSANQIFVHGTNDLGWGESYWLGLKEGKITFSLAGTESFFGPLEVEASLLSKTWYHLVGTYNGSNVEIYLNGIKIKSQQRTGKITGEYGLRIGRTPGFPSQNVLIDEVRIYKESLTSTQIKKLYAEGLKKHEI